MVVYMKTGRVFVIHCT